ncbi:unnamed protein product [Psylliodes chrysocephalus]|uniref:Uncharacterized protein n=1 Tax=Psylliodes chrysocephalus TaxID=3402493 RepID=A0A9P0GHP9_9CUCU|nr:unnamed protein product [Psylliodes chrysocephala]
MPFKRPRNREKGARDNSARASTTEPTDAAPRHTNCPEGADSWRTWQKAKADGQIEDYTHKPPMKTEVFDAIRPVYEDLSRDDLLERCLGEYTQKANESFKACIWSISPKTTHSGKNIVDIAASVARLVLSTTAYQALLT